jgi:hypothetical protein
MGWKFGLHKIRPAACLTQPVMNQSFWFSCVTSFTSPLPLAALKVPSQLATNHQTQHACLHHKDKVWSGSGHPNGQYVQRACMTAAFISLCADCKSIISARTVLRPQHKRAEIWSSIMQHAQVQAHVRGRGV